MLIPRVQIRHKLFTRLLLSHIFLVTIPLLITGQILVNTAQDAIEKTILERNLELARRSSWLIDATLGRAKDLLNWNAQSPAFYTSDRMSQELLINNLVSQFPIFQKIAILDTLGQVLSSTSYGARFKIAGNDGIDNYAHLNQSYTSKVYLSDEKLPLMNIAEPIFVFGEVEAILVAEVDLKEIWALVDSNLVSDRSEAFIFQEDGQYVAHSDRRHVLEGLHFSEKNIIAEILNGVSGNKTYTTQSGAEMIVAYAPISVLNKRWGTVIQQPTDEAFAPARTLRLQIFLLMIVSVIIAAIIAIMYTQQIVRPVDQLVAGIEKISGGDLKYRIPRLGKDEISTLALHFNAMTGRLRRIQERLKRTERFETLSKLSTVLSHEIRNPLNSMVINMQLMKREFNKKRIDRKRLDHYHQILSSEVHRVDDLVSNFMRIAKPPKLNKSLQRLDEILDNLIKTEMPQVLQKGIRVIRQYEIKQVELNIDTDKMYQVFLNIFINAVQAMPGGGVLTVGLQNANSSLIGDDSREYVAVSFKDTGKGISKDEQSKIFDFYYSTKNDGTGIGLAFALQIIEEHGGTIQVESEPKKGSNFIILLPMKK